MRSMRNRQAGFTIIEMLVVLAIAGVVAAMALPVGDANARRCAAAQRCARAPQPAQPRQDARRGEVHPRAFVLRPGELRRSCCRLGQDRAALGR